MERRIGTVLIYVENREAAPQVNAVLSRHASIIICRQGFPREHYSIISVIFEGTTDEIGSLTGQLGRIEGIEVKSALLKGHETTCLRDCVTTKCLEVSKSRVPKSITEQLNNLKLKTDMQFHPEKCRIPDEPNRPFISSEEIWDYINNTKSTPERVHEIIQKSLDKNRLTMEETAVLVNTTDPGLVEEIKEGARELKRSIYGNRIVLFAPLYVGNYCVNNCKYCGFRSSNKQQVRTTLTDEELVRNVEALEEDGQKRLILVYGESPKSSPADIAHTVKVTDAT